MSEPTYEGVLQQHTFERLLHSLQYADSGPGWVAGTRVVVAVTFPDAIQLHDTTVINTPDVEERIRAAAERVINTLRRAQGDPDATVTIAPRLDRMNVVRLVRPDEDPA